MVNVSRWLGNDLENLKDTNYFSEYYQKYSEYYNSNKIKALSDFESIISALENREKVREQHLDTTIKILKSNIASLCDKVNEQESKELLDRENELQNLLDEIFATNWINTDVIKKPTQENIEDLFSVLIKFVKSVTSQPYRGWGADYIIKARDEYETLQRIDVHKRTLIFMRDEILDRGYEKEFKSLKEMTEAEREEIQKEIEGKAGRKNEKAVPQKKVEVIVKGRIKNRNSKRFIHQNGKYKGRANVNQIYKYIEENHYTLAKNLSERRMKTRIKKALPKDMK